MNIDAVGRQKLYDILTMDPEAINSNFDRLRKDLVTLAAALNDYLLDISSTTDITGILAVANGGTGFGSYTIGDLIYADTATTLAKLIDIATGNALISGGVGVAPSYGKIGLTTHVSGTLPAASGGTGLASYTIGDLIYASASTTLSKLIDAATGNALISGGAGVAPSYGKIGLTTHVSGTLPATSGGTGMDLYSNGVLIYASSTTTLGGFAAAATGNVLLSGGIALPPSWGKVPLTTHISGTLPVANGGTGLTAGTSGGILGYTAAGTLASSGALTASRLVLGGGAGATPTVLGSLGTTTTVLHGDAAGAPTFAAVALATDVSGDLPFANLVQASAASRLVGRGSAAGAGDFEEITLGSGLSMSGTALSSTATGADLGAANTFTAAGNNFDEILAVDKGLQFPATQVANAGANVLDDYEEGTWPPVIGGVPSESGQAYSHQVGKYVKVGRMVTAEFSVALSTKGTITGELRLKGLPFTTTNTGQNSAGFTVSRWISMVTAYVHIGFTVLDNDTACAIDGNTAAATGQTALVTGDIGDSTRFIGTAAFLSAG
mgnify:FL=1